MKPFISFCVLAGVSIIALVGLWAGGFFQGANPPALSPVITPTGNYTYIVKIPDLPKPSESSVQRLPNSSPSGRPSAAGDVVVIHFQMHSWTTGEVVDSTRLHRNGEPMAIEAGYDEMVELRKKRLPVTDLLVPKFLFDSVVNVRAGQQLQVTFKSGMLDLPEYLDEEDAYLLVVDVLEVMSADEYLAKNPSS